jgi:flagellar hook-associated protein 2
MATGTNSALQLSGLASGIDWTSIINEMLTIAKAPEAQMQSQQTTDNNKKSAYQTIGKDITTLQGDITTLSDPTFFDSRTTSVSNPSVATATAAESTPQGNFTFNVTQLATAASQLGAAVAAKPLSSTSDVSGVVLGAAGFATPITAGTFSVDGKTITVATSDTLQSVFDQINTATGGAVTASYNPSTDEISLAGSSPIVLGSAADTSNFLQATELYNNSTGTVTSTSAVGGINLDSTLTSANLATAITDGGSGNGQFTINGVNINYNASTDTINDVLQRINSSAAGVTATFNGVNNQFELTNKTTGDVGISMQDVTGNFLAATGFSGGTLQRGNNLQYSINSGGTQTSQSNKIDASSSGLTGLSITALGTGTTTVSIGSDTSKIASAITSFVNDYNTVQNYISSQTSTSTNSSGNVTPGLLTGDLDSEDIETSLRQLVGGVPGGSSVIHDLNELGVASNGTDNTLAAPDATTLANTIANNLADVKNMFTNTTDGIATQLQTYLNNVNGPNGVLANDEQNLTKESNDVTTSINNLNQRLTNEQTELTAEFTAMETAINTINAEKQYLTAYFNSGSTTSNSAPTAAGSNLNSSSPLSSSSGL